MTSHSQLPPFATVAPALQTPAAGMALLLLSAAALLLARRRLRHRRFRLSLTRFLRDRTGMPLGLFLAILLFGVPLLVGGLLVLLGVPVLTSILLGVGALVLLVLLLLAGLYFFGGEREG